MFGLESRPIIGAGDDRVIVYPEIVPMARLGLPARGPLPELTYRHALIEDPYRFAGVRPYTPGDRPRTIAWTASARSGGLLTRRLEPVRSRDTVVCLDLSRRHHAMGRTVTAVELAVTAAASISHHILARERLRAGLYVFGEDPLAGSSRPSMVPVGGGHGHLMEHLEILARVSSTPDDEFVPGLEEMSGRLPFGATVVVITGDLRLDLQATLSRLRGAGHVPAIVVVAPETPPPARVDGIDVFSVADRTGLGALV